MNSFSDAITFSFSSDVLADIGICSKSEVAAPNQYFARLRTYYKKSNAASITEFLKMNKAVVLIDAHHKDLTCLDYFIRVTCHEKGIYHLQKETI